MKATFIPIDSEVFGGAVLAIEEFSAAGFEAFEAGYVAEHDPLYVSCKVPLDRIGDVHALERQGFELIECQIRTKIDLRRPYDVPDFGFEFRRVTSAEELDGVLAIAATAFSHDRFSVDPRLDRRLSGERYRRYVRRSFEAEDERVYRLVDPQTSHAVAFKTHRYLPNGEVLLLLGGVDPAVTRSGIGVINTCCEIAELRGLGFTTAITHVSAANHPVVNVEIAKLGFRVIGTFAVMRKIYR